MNDEDKNGIRYPEIVVKIMALDDGIKFLNMVIDALHEAGVSNNEITEYKTDAFANDYNHMMFVTMAWVIVE